MRQRIFMGIAIAAAVMVAIGGLIVANQSGVFGGKAKHLVTLALREKDEGQLAEAQAHLEELVATFPDSPWADDGLFALGQVYEAQQQWMEARAMYQTLLDRFPESPLLAATQTQLGQANIALLFSPTVTELDALYEVKPGDTLGKIASAHGTTVEFLKKANHLKSDVIQPRLKLKVPTGRFSVVVDKSQNQLLLTENNRFIKSYGVATGKDNSTPVGTFKIVTKIPNPVWYKQDAVVPPESPDNILGTRWMGIDKKGYGIHGSVDPNAIGHQVTAGCVRMVNSDVEELFSILPVGAEVTIVD